MSATTYGGLKINNASGATLAGTTTVNGTLSLTTGTLAVGTNTLNINNGTAGTPTNLTSGATGTVNYGQASAGQTVLAINYGNLTFSNFNKILPAATMGVAGTFTPGTAVGHTILNSTFDFNGAGAQTVPAFNYHHLTISGNRGGAAITLGAGTIGVAGNFTPSVSNNTFVNTGNTFTFNGSAAQTIPAFASFNNLTINNAAGVTLSGDATVGAALTLTSGTLGVVSQTLTLNGAVSGAGTLSSLAGGTVNYNQGSAGQAVLAANYGNLTFSNFNKTLPAGTVGIAGTFTTGNATGHTITGNTILFNGASPQTIPGFTYNNLTSSGAVGRTLDPINTIKIAGIFTPGTSTYTSTGSTIEYNGAAGQTTPATGFGTYNNLRINDSGGVTLGSDITVNNALTLLSGNVTTNAFTLSMASTGTSSRTSGHIIGKEKKTYGGAGSFTFDVGTANGYSPLDTTVTAGAGDLTVGAVQGAEPNLTATQQTNSLQRYWDLSGTGITTNLVFHYNDPGPPADVAGIESNYRIIRVTGTTPVTFENNCGAGSPCVNTAANTLTINGVSNFSHWAAGDFTFLPTAADGEVVGRITDSTGAPVVGAVIRLSGTQNRKTITDANGNYRFANVETNGFYTVTPSRANYNFSPATRTFNQLAEKTEALFTGASAGDLVNPLDTTEYFVRQQYVDLLGREPDEGGFNYWSDQILVCGSDAVCTSARRRDVAAAFFIEAEFQQTGSFIYDLYKGTLGRQPAYAEFSMDHQQVVAGPNLTAQKQALAKDFVQRSEFVQKYQASNTAETFVAGLLNILQQSSGVDLSTQRTEFIDKYNSGANMVDSRGAVVLAVGDNVALRLAEYNRAFVLTEYFSYLRRDPDAGGYAFWLNVLNTSEAGNFRGMVCAFTTSAEYQKRFSSVVSRTDRECGQ